MGRAVLVCLRRVGPEGLARVVLRAQAHKGHFLGGCASGNKGWNGNGRAEELVVKIPGPGGAKGVFVVADETPQFVNFQIR